MIIDQRTLHALVAFSSTDIIGLDRLKKIQEYFPNIHEFLEQDTASQIQILGLKSDNAAVILSNMVTQADKILEICNKKNIGFLTLGDPSYPDHLAKIPDAPYLLYTRGTFKKQIPLLAVIGTRKSTPDAEKVNQWFCKTFVDYGIGVVSGMAKGHDAIASTTVLNNDGYTVAVLGTSIDIIYPAHFSRLYHRIIEHGVIMSEYPPLMSTTKWRFPRRNRIVSGISQGVFVIQAPEKSGTMITVNMALKQGKEIYVVPGNVLMPEYSGTNSLLQNGAKVVLNPQDIVRDILDSSSYRETKNFLNNTSLPEKEYIIDPSLSAEEQCILKHTKNNIHIDDLVHLIDINISALNSILTMMEIKGLLIQKPGHIYQRVEV